MRLLVGIFHWNSQRTQIATSFAENYLGGDFQINDWDWKGFQVRVAGNQVGLNEVLYALWSFFLNE